MNGLWTIGLVLFLSAPAETAPGDEVADREGFAVIRSLDELRQAAGVDNSRVRLQPGTYEYRELVGDGESLLTFSGNDAHYDLTGVTLRAQEYTTVMILTGDRITVEGLKVETVLEPSRPPRGRRSIAGVGIHGHGNTLLNVRLHLRGSFPYGYGSFFGISGGPHDVIKPNKNSGIHITGNYTRILGCRVIMRSFGHGIFMRGASNTLIQDTLVEGELRSTDEMLAETSGPAFEVDFKTMSGQRIPAGRMETLQEDGIRTYGGTFRPDNRTTGDVTIKNTTVRRMRRGICLGWSNGRHTITDTTVTECTSMGYHIGSNATIRDSRGDVRYSHLLDISHVSFRGSDIELEVQDSGSRPRGGDLLARINGRGHRVVLRAADPKAVSPDMNIEIAADRGYGAGRFEVSGSSIHLVNETPAGVILNPQSANCTVESAGKVEDHGHNNTVRRRP